jgi:DNA-binding PadR family transcriptional regulator
VTQCYYEAKLEPSNTSQMIVQNIKRGFLMEAKGSERGKKGRKYYTLTQSGLAFVENAFKKPKG